ncbi:MAG: MFS transporter [Gemmatales bacterium]|nr:MFS transporter [Gemmatales bacterium]MDW7994735.1 MFS transporter [Gemmatales bacterium]
MSEAHSSTDSFGASVPPRRSFRAVDWLIVIIAAMGFAFDIYELLMMPLIARPALAELLGVDPYTTSGNAAILRWTGYIMWGSAISGGLFGLLGGYLTDLLGRRRVLVWSILLYAFSACAAGFSTSVEMLLLLRCTTFIGVCVEFVAAVAWLAELFPNPRQREAVLGYTQAFSSVGGLLVTVAYYLCVQLAPHLPPIYGEHAPWRYTLISGVIPALPLIVIRPFLPESPVWETKRRLGQLKRPSIAELFSPAFRRTTLVTTILFACSYGAAFGAIQLTPQMVPGLIPELRPLAKLRLELDEALRDQDRTRIEQIRREMRPLLQRQEQAVSRVQLAQEIGGLCGRFILAWLVVRIVSRRLLLRLFVLPAMIVLPLLYAFPAAGRLPAYNLEILTVGIFFAGVLIVGQFSFWGNYLPRVYPVYLRGTGESFAANVGGRMIGTAANPLSTIIFAPLWQSLITELRPFQTIAQAAATTSLLVLSLALVLSFFLPEPRQAADE